MKNVFPLLATLLAFSWTATHAQTATGNVGIGTPTPTQKLDVNGGLRLRGLAGDGLRLPQVQPDGTLTTTSAAPYDTPLPNVLTPVGGAVATPTRPRTVAVAGSRAYVLSSNVPGNAYLLQAYDVSNPAVAPIPVGAPVPAGQYATDMVVAGNRAYVLSDNTASTIQVYDISNPAGSPVPVGAPVATVANALALAVGGVGNTRLFVTGVNQQLQAYDISNPASLLPVGSPVTTGVNPKALAATSTRLYVLSSFNRTLQTYDITNPNTGPQSVGMAAPTGMSPASVAVAGNQAFVTDDYDNTLLAYDVRTGNPTRVGAAVPTGRWPIAVAVAGSRAYVLNYYDNTLQPYDVSDPTAAPIPVGTAQPTGSLPVSLAVDANRAYLVNNGSSTLQAYAIGQPPRGLVVQADGSLASAPAPLLRLNGTTLSLAGGNSVTLPGDNLGTHRATQDLDLGANELVGNGGSSGLSITSGGYVRLGPAAPALRTKELTGTVPSSSGSQAFIPHGLTDAKIMSVTALVPQANNQIPPGYTLNPGVHYGVYIYAGNVVVQTAPGADANNIVGQPIRILITYKE